MMRFVFVQLKELNVNTTLSDHKPEQVVLLKTRIRMDYKKIKLNYAHSHFWIKKENNRNCTIKSKTIIYK